MDQFIRVPEHIIRDQRVWVKPGRYPLIRRVSPERYLIRTGSTELTIVKEGQGFLE